MAEVIGEGPDSKAKESGRDGAKVSSQRIAADDPRVVAGAAGDPQAIEALCRALLPRVRNLVRFLVRGDADVDDLAQDGIIEVLRSLQSFRGDSAFTTWADRIVVRTTLHSQRRARARAVQLRLVQSERAEQGPAVVAVDSFGYLARRHAVRALDELPEEQRSAVVLHHVVGMSVPEVAESLAVPFETAKSRIRLGMAKLRKGLSGGEHDG